MQFMPCFTVFYGVSRSMQFMRVFTAFWPPKGPFWAPSVAQKGPFGPQVGPKWPDYSRFPVYFEGLPERTAKRQNLTF